MPTYFNVFLMLLATIAAFVILAKLAQSLRSGRLPWTWRRGDTRTGPAASALMQVEQSCFLDGRRRLVAVRCGDHRVLLLTGGPADLVVSTFLIRPAQGDQS